MFHRRLVAIGVIVALAFTAIGARIWSLTISEGQERLAEAESRLGRTKLLPTVRGRITDRQGRVLAEDVPAYGVAIEFAAIDGRWVRSEARRLARRELGAATWSSLTRRGREAAAERFEPLAQRQFDEVLDEVCRTTGLPREELDARLDRVYEEVTRRAAVVRERQQRAWVARYGDGALETFRADPINEERRAHEVIPEVSDSTAFALRRLADAVPGIVTVTDSVRRVYPRRTATIEVDRSTFPSPLRSARPVSVTVDGVAEHIVGRCRTETWREDLERRPFMRPDGQEDLGGYRPGSDLIGHSGVERTQEEVLRGLRGRVTTRLDSGAEERSDAEPGRDLQLTLDIALQARVEALLDPAVGLTTRHPWHDAGAGEDESRSTGFAEGTPLASAVVVIDVDLGEILVAASWPPPSLAASLPPGERERLAPGIHRAIDGIYSPGSILKPLVYLAATAEGAFPIDGTVACHGHFFPDNPQVARCWIFRPRYGMGSHTARTGGALTAAEALARSCNIYFYTLAQRLGPERFTAWMRRFGLGAPLGIGLLREVTGTDGSTRMIGESGGSLPTEAMVSSMRERRDALTPIILGIGQGPIAWTPLQAANAYATIAREGVRRDATLIRAPREAIEASRPHEAPGEAMDFPPRAVAQMIDGLRRAVEASYGTAHHLQFGEAREPIFDTPGVRVYGKTGTAQAPPLRLDIDGDGTVDRTISGLDHAWFAGLVGDRSRDRPRYAMAVLVEYGGSGGKVAGPVAAQVIRALVEEGYLEADSPRRSDRRPRQ
ncbi:MAG: hypothetical protein KF724_09920 [Phycisphaeraceae bacterium]|nr:hypothetical protein [Phycisphaeraceae bacterium]